MARGLRNCDGSRPTYLKLLRLFAQGQGEFAERFARARRAGAAETATRLAHTLKSVAGSIGALALSEAARALEDRCRNDAPPAQVDAALRDVIASLNPVLEGLARVPAAAPADPGDAPSTAAGTLLEALAHLHRLLQRSDTEAVEHFNQVREALRSRVGADTIQQLEQSIGRFDFEAALHLLQDITETLRRDTGASPEAPPSP